MKKLTNFTLGRIQFLQVIGLSSLWISVLGSGFYNWGDSNFYRGQAEVDMQSDFFYVLPKIIYALTNSDAAYIFIQIVLASVAILFLAKELDHHILKTWLLAISKILVWSLLLSPFFAPWQRLVLSEGFFLSWEILLLGALLKFLRTHKNQDIPLILLSLLLLALTKPISVFVVAVVSFSLIIGLTVQKNWKLIVWVLPVCVVMAALGIKPSNYDPTPNQLSWMDDGYRSLQLGIESEEYLDVLNEESGDICPVEKITSALYNFKFEELSVNCPNLYQYVVSRPMLASRINFIITSPLEYLRTQSVISSTIPNYYSQNAFSVLPEGIASLFINSTNSDSKINSGGGYRLNAPIVIWILSALYIFVMSWFRKLYIPIVFSSLALSSAVSILFVIQLPGVAETGRHPVPLLFLFYAATFLSATIYFQHYKANKAIYPAKNDQH